MAVITKGTTFANGDQVTAEKLNNLADEATFASDAVDNVSTQLSGGGIIVKDGGITPAKLSTGGPSWDSTVMLLTGGGDGANIELYGASHPDEANRIFHDAETHVFRSTDLTELMRMDSAGRLLVGTTATNPASSFNPSSPNGVSIVNNKIEISRTGGPSFDINRAESGTIAIFRQAGTLVGYISVTGSSTSYNTSSDYRLKEDIIELDDSLERLKALKPCNFAWKADGSRTDGFIAHEAQEVVPEAVTGTKDAVDDEGNPDYQGIDQSKLVPLLTKALQEAVAKIESLEARVTELES
jgi:hypothetical protein